jgi:hypothetical protein
MVLNGSIPTSATNLPDVPGGLLSLVATARAFDPLIRPHALIAFVWSACDLGTIEAEVRFLLRAPSWKVNQMGSDSDC